MRVISLSNETEITLPCFFKLLIFKDPFCLYMQKENIQATLLRVLSDHSSSKQRDENVPQALTGHARESVQHYIHMTPGPVGKSARTEAQVLLPSPDKSFVSLKSSVSSTTSVKNVHRVGKADDDNDEKVRKRFVREIAADDKRLSARGVYRRTPTLTASSPQVSKVRKSSSSLPGIKRGEVLRTNVAKMVSVHENRFSPYEAPARKYSVEEQVPNANDPNLQRIFSRKPSTNTVRRPRVISFTSAKENKKSPALVSVTKTRLDSKPELKYGDSRRDKNSRAHAQRKSSTSSKRASGQRCVPRQSPAPNVPLPRQTKREAPPSADNQPMTRQSTRPTLAKHSKQGDSIRPPVPAGCRKRMASIVSTKARKHSTSGRGSPVFIGHRSPVRPGTRSSPKIRNITLVNQVCGYCKVFKARSLLTLAVKALIMLPQYHTAQISADTWYDSLN